MKKSCGKYIPLEKYSKYVENRLSFCYVFPENIWVESAVQRVTPGAVVRTFGWTIDVSLYSRTYLPAPAASGEEDTE